MYQGFSYASGLLWNICMKYHDVLTAEELHAVSVACAIIYEKHLEELQIQMRQVELEQKERRFGE